MTESTKTIEFKFERTIPAPPGEVFDAWLNFNSCDGSEWQAHVDGSHGPKQITHLDGRQ